MWAADGVHELTVRVLRVQPGEIGVVVAAPAIGDALADVLAGLAQPRRGTVSLDGVPVTGRPAGRCPIALVPPGGGLLPQLTVERNVGFGLSGQMPRSAWRGRVNEVLGQLQLESLRRKRPHEISPVQRLRVAVARALCAPVEPLAVVVEDRRGQIPGRAAAVTAAAQDLSVLVITDAPERGGGLTPATQAACRPARDKDPGQDQDPGPGPDSAGGPGRPLPGDAVSGRS
jgi:ABC-type thiamine transport system ATPase subunit